MANPDAITLEHIASRAPGDLSMWLRDRKNRRAIPHRLERCGYVAVHYDGAKDKLWKINGRRQAIYGNSNLSTRSRLEAAKRLINQGN
jgi:hypothetical protein